MDKVKLEYKAPEMVTEAYNGVGFEINPILSAENQVGLINQYIETYFGENEEKFVVESEYSYLEAELQLFNMIVQLNTNIDIDSVVLEMYAEMSLSSKVLGSIQNYGDFRNKLNYVINEIKQQESLRNSIGKVVSDLVAKGYDVLNKLTDISPETIEALQKTGLELANTLKESSVLGEGGIPASKEEEPK